MNYYIGIDVGTSGTKAVLFDIYGNIVSSHTIEYNIISPKIGYAEENPIDWKNAVIGVLKELSSSVNPNDIKGIGLTGQMHGLVMLDEFDNVLDNAIIWCDNRCLSEAKEIESFGIDRIREITGNNPMQAFTLAKLLWVRNNKKDIYDKISKIMLPKDYIRYILTGAFMTEYSDASGMQMMDLKGECWSKELLDYFNISEDILPKLAESDDITGYIKDDISKLTGLSTNTFVVGGAGDQAAGALGSGIISEGDVSISLGSSGVVFSALDNFVIKDNPLQYFHHALHHKYHNMAVTNGCGNSLKWYRNLLFENLSYKELTKNINDVKPGCDGLVFLPYVYGERTPHNNPNATGLFIGLNPNTTKDMMTRSVIEGISYSIKDCFELIDTKINNVYIFGGGAINDDWCNIISSMLGYKLLKINVSESPALGVAMLAMIAGGEYKDISNAVKNIIKVTKTYIPNMDDNKIYNEYFEIYKNLYIQNENIYKLVKEKRL